MRFNGEFNYSYKNVLIFLALFTISSLVSLPSKAYSVEQPLGELSIKPLTCIVKVAGDNCQMTVTVTWKTSVPISGCLFQEENNLACWQEQNEVSQQLTISLAKEMIFSLKNQHGFVIAKQTIKVNASTSSKYRRRLRAQWSLF